MLRARCAGFGAVVLGMMLGAAGGWAAARPVALPGVLEAGDTQGTAASAIQDVGGIELPSVNLFDPFLAVYGQRGVLRWRADSNAVLSVDYGETPALGLHAEEVPVPTRGGLLPGGLLGGQPDSAVHEVSLEGLQTGRAYYYRGRLWQDGAVLADTGVVPFETPLAFVRVQPYEIAMAKDGDHDIEVSVNGNEVYDNENKGEVYLEWSVRPRPAPGDWPFGAKVKGCYPGGAAIDLLFPDAPQPDAGGQDSPDHPADDTTFDPTTGAETPALHGDPQAWMPIDGCVAYRYDAPVRVDEAKIGSGEEVALDPEGYPPMEWELPAELPAEPPPAAAMLAPPGDDGEPYQPPAGGGSAPQPACGDAPPGSFALVRVAVRGQEFDTILAPAGLTRIINHDASNADTLCLDLRQPEQTVRMGVKAEDGSLEFTVWFDVTLDYRTIAEAAAEEEPPGSIGTPIVRPPSDPAAFAVSGEPQGGATPAPADAAGRPFVNLRAPAKLRETKRSGAKVTFTRSGDTSYPLFVAYTIGGTAQNGVDYRPLLGTLEIPAGKRSAKLVVQPIADGEVEEAETIELGLLPDYGYAPGASAKVALELTSKDR